MAAKPHFEVPSVFSTKAVKPSRIPADDVLIQDAQTMLAASASWPAGKSYANVRTSANRSTESPAQHWHCVVSEFRAAQTPFARIWAKLGRDQVLHQQSHLAGLMKVARVEYISERQSIWTTLVTAAAPMSPRIYSIYQTSWLFEFSHRQRGIVVTLPVDLSSGDYSQLEEEGVRGRYVSIEHLQEIGEDMIEWRRVSCRELGGMIPKCWVQRQMAGAMAKESIAFMNWLSRSGDDDESECRNSEDGPHYHTPG